MRRLEVLVEMLGGEAGIALTIQPLDFVSLSIGHRPPRAPANSPVKQPFFTLLLKPARPSPERALTHSQNFRRLELTEPSNFPAAQHIFELQHPQSL